MEVTAIDWLPAADVVMARAKAAAAGDVLLSSDADFRQFRCIGKYADGMTAAWRHDGAGSYYYVLQSGNAMAVKVCANRLSIGPDALARFQKSPDVAMPPVALRLLTDPEFRYQEMSFLAWTENGAPWQGLLLRVDNMTSLEIAKPLLEPLLLGPRAYYVNAQSYHEVTVDPTALKALYALTPMDEALAKSIAPGVNFTNARKELEAIGYPMG
ncbi:hypothetical protein BH09SUM1_BH09SUM1_21240 [soil metagenome]